MTPANPFLDDAGEQVSRFVSAARNLSRVGELTDEIVAIAKSGAWRRYKTALGVDEWRDCELDYFLIACDLRHEDISRVTAYTGEGAALAPLMDRDANKRRRRPLEQASAAWHAPGPETLIERAQRLGWTRGTSTVLRAAPLPERARTRYAHGVTADEHARQTRSERVSPARRRQLDALVKRVRGELTDDDERRYVIDHLRSGLRAGRRGRRTTESDVRGWRADAKRHKWDTNKLAAEWNVSLRQAQRRIDDLRADT